MKDTESSILTGCAVDRDILMVSVAAIVSMLRGINLASHKRVKMDTLRGVYESLGLRNPQSYIQSGNVVFTSEEQDLAGLTKRIEQRVHREFGFHADVILRTVTELREVIARNPFAKRRDIEPSRLLVVFLANDPGKEARDKILDIKADPEELRMTERDLYIYFPNGMARPKLSIPLIDKTLKTSGTGRNWNSVVKLLEMAEELEDASAN